MSQNIKKEGPLPCFDGKGPSCERFFWRFVPNVKRYGFGLLAKGLVP